MKISVVIPAFNEELYLPHTLGSLGRQTRQPDEIIVVDGNSTDKTRAIARSHNCRIVIPRKRGIGLARQTGLLKARGDIIACTDADTIVPQDWLDVIEKTITQPGVVGTYGNFRVHGGPWWYALYVNHCQEPCMRFMDTLGFPMAAGQNMAFRKEAAVRAGGFPVNFTMVEDNEMLRRLRTRGKMIYHKIPVVISSGRRGREGIKLPLRYAAAFFLYFIFRRGDIIGFRDYR